MRTRIEAHDDGVAIVIPVELAAKAGLRPGEAVEVTLVAGRVSIGPEGDETLAELLDRITPENLHIGWPDGPSIERELL